MLDVRSEKYAVKVVEFMAEADGGYSLAGVCHVLALHVLRADGHSRGAARHAENARNGQTALVSLLFADGFRDLGIYQLEHFSVVVENNDDAAQYPYLRSGKSETFGEFQRVLHIADEVFEPLIEFFDSLTICLIAISVLSS